MLSSIASQKNQTFSPASKNEKWWTRSDADSVFKAKRTEQVMREDKYDEMNFQRLVNSDTGSLTNKNRGSIEMMTSPANREIKKHSLATEKEGQLITIEESNSPLEEYQQNQMIVRSSPGKDIAHNEDKKATVTSRLKQKPLKQEPQSLRLIKKTIKSSQKMVVKLRNSHELLPPSGLVLRQSIDELKLMSARRPTDEAGSHRLKSNGAVSVVSASVGNNFVSNQGALGDAIDIIMQPSQGFSHGMMRENSYLRQAEIATAKFGGTGRQSKQTNFDAVSFRPSNGITNSTRQTSLED